MIGFILFFAVIFSLIGLFYSQSVYYGNYYDLISTVLIGGPRNIYFSDYIYRVLQKKREDPGQSR